ncbi:syntaxin-22-like isoform X2 [Aristolochia californica]|uniref:syntaxin-22-like isoform X2 n=1 Tax=Aristolochia californica TaxID=171875 RepID=UPI0035D9FE13
MSFQDLESNVKLIGRQRGPTGNTSVASGIFQINTAVLGLRRLVEAIGTVKDTPEHRQKIHDTRQRIGQLVKETSAKLRALTDSDIQDSNPSKRIEDAKLARDFQAILQEYQKVQQLAAERESTYAPSVPPSSFPSSSSTTEQTNQEEDQDSQTLLRDQKRLEVLLLDTEVAFHEAIIDEREQGVKEIQDQIVEANEIMKDLAVLIHDQGITIDQVESNIEGAYSATVQAKTQLSKVLVAGHYSGGGNSHRAPCHSHIVL